MTASPSLKDQPPPAFDPGSIGAFLARGADGWPAEYTAHIAGAAVRVASSRVRVECQSCSRRGMRDGDVRYVRVALDICADRDGAEHLLHVEELFPDQILEVLDESLDVHAAARVRRTILEKLVELHDEHPVENLISNCIAPMRLFEPLLNALVAPPRRGSLAEWLGAHIPEVMCQQRDELIAIEAAGCRARVRALELGLTSTLRARGALGLKGEVQISCSETGEVRWQSKGRATLVGPTTRWDRLPAPDESSRLKLRAAIQSWRDELAANLTRRLEQGGRDPIRLVELLPELLLDEALGAEERGGSAA